MNIVYDKDGGKTRLESFAGWSLLTTGNNATDGYSGAAYWNQLRDN